MKEMMLQQTDPTEIQSILSYPVCILGYFVFLWCLSVVTSSLSFQIYLGPLFLKKHTTEIIEIGAEIMEIENAKTIRKNSTKLRVGFYERSTKLASS